jgi:hypothetical protein
MDKQPLTIAIAIPSYSWKVSIEFSLALAQNVAALQAKNIKVNYLIVAKSHIHTARNSIIKSFVENTNADYLFFLDDDIIMTDNYIKNILDIAISNDIHVLTGLYKQKDDQRSAKKSITQSEDIKQYVAITDDERRESLHGDCVMPIDASGLGAMLIHTHAVTSAYHASYWYPCLRSNTKHLLPDWNQLLVIEGEDISLCKYFHAAWYRIYCRTGAVLQHQRQ